MQTKYWISTNEESSRHCGHSYYVFSRRDSQVSPIQWYLRGEDTEYPVEDFPTMYKYCSRTQYYKYRKLHRIPPIPENLK